MPNKKRHWLIKERVDRGLTQESVAQRINISQTTYSTYELGTRNPKGKVAYELSKLFGIPMEKFFEE